MRTSLLHSLQAAFFAGATFALLAAGPLANALEVTNVKDGDVFRYPLVVVEGTTKGQLQLRTALETSLDTTVANKFRGVVELKAGKNEVTFQDDAGSETLTLTYQPATAKDYRIKVWYVVPKGEDPLKVKADQIDARYQSKLDILTKVMQSWVAEDMKRGGYGPKTFYPEFRKDDPSKVDVGLLYVNQTARNGMRKVILTILPGRCFPRNMTRRNGRTSHLSPAPTLRKALATSA